MNFQDDCGVSSAEIEERSIASQELLKQLRPNAARKKKTKPRSMAVRVSDHALLRYAERVLGWDSQEAEADIVKAIGSGAAVLGDGTFPFRGMLAVVKNYTVLSIIPK
jgi:hypothetical protein